jgi:hypothetical protein
MSINRRGGQVEKSNVANNELMRKKRIKQKDQKNSRDRKRHGKCNFSDEELRQEKKKEGEAKERRKISK